MTTVAELVQIASTDNPVYASQDVLDEVGHILDELERVEIYMNSPSCSLDEYADCEAEVDRLTDQLNYYLEII